MTTDDVYVIGVGSTRYGGPPQPLTERVFTAGRLALADAGIEFGDVRSMYVGYNLSEPTFGYTATKNLGLTGIPITHVENASATGASAFREAARSVRLGDDVALAVGFDDPAIMGGFNSVRRGVSAAEAAITPAAFFALWAVRRMHERGTSERTLAAIAAKNLNTARHCTIAQRQRVADVTVEEVLAAPMLAYPHTKLMAAPQGAAASAVIVASERFVRRHGTGGRPAIRVIASQQRTEVLLTPHLFVGAIVGPPEMTRRAAAGAYEESGVGPNDLDLVQVHDAYAIEELEYYELLGICAEGSGDALVADGATTLGGRVPFSTDGGFIGRGHPGGPTGLAQILELTQQLRGESGPRQVEGARTGLAHITGAGSTCFIHILQRLPARPASGRTLASAQTLTSGGTP